MSNNKDFKVKNGIQPTVYHEGLGTVTSGSEGYYLAGAVYDNKSFSVTSQDATPYGLFFKPDGTKFYMIGASNDTVHQYTCSTSWDVSTASYDSVSFSIAAQEILPTGIFFKLDGTAMYVSGQSGDDLNQYTLSTAWDISTASFDSKTLSLNQSTNPYGCFFKPDGTKFYSVDAASNTVYQYTLSTAWDVSTGSYDSVSFSVASQETGATLLYFNSDGTVMYAGGQVSDSLFEYSLSTAYDISTAVYSGTSYSFATEDASPTGIYFKPDGTKLYMVGLTNDTIYQYSTALNTNTLDLSTGSVFEITPTSDIQINLSNPADSGTVSQATLLLDQAGYGGYDLSNSAYDNVNFSVATEETSLQAVEFKTDGTKMYIIGAVGDDINQYSLSTAWDISTASYEKKTSGLADTIPSGLAFKSDGTKVYIVGYGTDTVYEYTLSTAWDLATISVSASASFSVSTQDGTPTALTFKSDGSAMYVLGNVNDNVYQYTLSTSWDLSTASYASKTFSFSSEENQVQGMAFKPDGSELYVVGHANDTVYKYSLSTAWDVSTASYSSTNFSVATQETSPNAIVFKDDGTKMYIGGLTNTIYQYSTATPATITYDSTLEWPSGTAPTSPAIGDTDVLTFSTTDGGTSYQAVQAINGAK